MKRRLKSSVFALTVILANGATLGYRKAYWTWWQTPQRITYCERIYLGGTTTHSRAEIGKLERFTALPGDAPYPVVTVGKVPPVVGQPLLAAIVPEATRRKLGLPCAMGVYLNTGADTYASYTISGGP